MGKASITIDFDPDRLSTYTDQYLAMLWHLTQHNPADGFRDKEPGDLAMHVGWEIIRRRLGTVSPEMYHHQQQHYTWWQLTRFARYSGGGWAALMIPGSQELRDALAGRLAELKVFGGTMSHQQLAQELADIVMPQQAADGQGAGGSQGAAGEPAS
jgi:hypothetical protein